MICGLVLDTTIIHSWLKVQKSTKKPSGFIFFFQKRIPIRNEEVEIFLPFYYSSLLFFHYFFPPFLAPICTQHYSLDLFVGFGRVPDIKSCELWGGGKSFRNMQM